MLHADANGIVSIPHQIAKAVAQLCEPFIKVEQIILDYLENKNVIPEGYKEATQKFREAKKSLERQAQSFLSQ